MFIHRSLNSERDALEPPEACDDDECDNTKRDGLGAFRETTCSEDKVVQDMCEHEDREV